MIRPRFVCMTTSFGGRDLSELQAAVPGLELCIDTEGDAMKNFLRLITWSEGPLVLLEDDAEPCDGFYNKVLNATAQCPHRIINFFSLRKKDYQVGHPFFEAGSKYLGNVCYYLPAGYGQQIAEYYKTWPRKAEHPTGYDLLMADWLKSRKESYLQWFPHLVNHKVCKSIINPRRSSARTDKHFTK